jgi:tRNA threonylcarbamoyladenosine dehydratase
VTLSSLNRHATATLSDVGTPKVGCIERTLKQISRWVEVDSRVEIWRKEDGGSLLEGADWVIGECRLFLPGSWNTTLTTTPCPSLKDAIDNITTKVDLLKYCHDHDIKVCGKDVNGDGIRLLAGVLVYGRWRQV